MPNKDHATNPPPEKPGGEGWLVRPEQQLVFQFKADSATVHAQWVAVRTYSWVPPRPPVPQTRRRMLRHNAVQASPNALGAIDTQYQESASMASKGMSCLVLADRPLRR